jgi:hypothetical protein
MTDGVLPCRRRMFLVSPFAYWHRSDHTILEPFIAEWSGQFPNFRALGDNDIEPLLGAILPEYVQLYRRIRLEAAKSDIARLALIHEFGGLYIDCHCGLRDPEGLRALFTRLDEFELVLWERSFFQIPRPKNEIRPINSILLARPKSQLIRLFLLHAWVNLSQQAEREARHGFVAYNIWDMIGAGNYRKILNVPNTGNTQLRPEFEGRIFFASEDDGPICLYRHNAYKTDPKQHWSRRQTREVLFEGAEAVALVSASKNECRRSALD